MSRGTEVRVRNRHQLADHGDEALRRLAIDLAEQALAALRPAAGLARAITLSGDEMILGDRRYDLSGYEQIVVLGAGKASAELALGLEDLLGRRLTHGLVAVPRGAGASSEHIRFIEGDHPLPTDDSAKAARAIVEVARQLGPRDLAICLFTGGSSALASLPPPGVSMADKRQLHRLLLASGMSIVEINTVRKHVSEFKGGRLARMIAPAHIINLTVSDVVGDPLDCISDPTVQDTSTQADAIAVLEDLELMDLVPASVRNHLLRSGAAPSPELDDLNIASVIVTRGHDGSKAVTSAAEASGFTGVSLGGLLEGEASTVGRVLATLGWQSRLEGTPWPRRSVVVGCGGECTVTLGPEGEQFGKGGPSQEAAVGAALALSGCEGVVALFIDTDGADGGTSVAGGIVDWSTVERARRQGISLQRVLASHETMRALERVGDAVVTGSTQTNANDLVLIVIS
jgi:glycerate 2-kinase